jgi:hypothetical protein
MGFCIMHCGTLLGKHDRLPRYCFIPLPSVRHLVSISASFDNPVGTSLTDVYEALIEKNKYERWMGRGWCLRV